MKIKKIILGIISGLFLVNNCFALMLPRVPSKRCVEIYGEIKETNMKGICQKLIELDKTKGDIRIYLNSPGGYIVDGLPIVTIMQTLKNDVQILASGQCSSLAMTILVMGTKGKRVITPDIIMYVHKVYVEEPLEIFTTIFGVPQEEEWDEEKWWEKRKEDDLVRHIQIFIDDLLFEHTKITHKELAEWDKNWIYADTIIKYEIADGIYEGEEIEKIEPPLWFIVSMILILAICGFLIFKILVW